MLSLLKSDTDTTSSRGNINSLSYISFSLIDWLHSLDNGLLMLCITLLLAIPEYLKVFKLVKLPRSAVNSTPLGRLTRKELLFLTKAQTNSALIIYHMSYIYVGYRYMRIVVMACRYQTYDYFKFERKRERTPLIQQAKFLSTTQIARCHKPHQLL